MTIGGAISDLNNLLKADNIPFYYKPSIKKVIETIEQDAIEQRIGHWIKTIGENGVTSAVRCSECGFEDNRYMLFRYCPNCGAKMQ